MEAAVVDVDRPRCRPFSLGDVMILIVAIALGLAVARPALSTIVIAIQQAPRDTIWSLARTIPLARFLTIVLLNFLGFLLPAFLVLRVRRPRPPPRLIVVQPGFAGCAAPVALVLFFVPLSLLAPAVMEQRIVMIAALGLIVAAVPLAWLALIATRQWAPEPSWIDRLGRGLAALWTLALPLHLVLIRLPY